MTTYLSRARAMSALDTDGGWVISYERRVAVNGVTTRVEEEAECWIHTTDEGAAVDLALPICGEDRERAEWLVAHAWVIR